MINIQQNNCDQAQSAIDQPIQNSGSSSSDSSSSIATVVGNKVAMDEDMFYAHLMELDDHSVEIDSFIARFNDNTVDLMDLDTYKAELQTIFARFSTFEKAYLVIKNKLDSRLPSDVPKINQIKHGGHY